MNYIEKIRRLNSHLNLPSLETDAPVEQLMMTSCECMCGKMLIMSFGPEGYEWQHRATKKKFCDFGSSNRTATPKGL